LDKVPIGNLNCKHSPDISDKPWEMFQRGNESAIRQYRPFIPQTAPRIKKSSRINIAHSVLQG